MEGMNYQSKSNQCSFLRHPASECTNLLLKVGLYSGSLCSAQSFININGILSFIYSFRLSFYRAIFSTLILLMACKPTGT